MMISKIEAVSFHASYANNVEKDIESDVNAVLYHYFGHTISYSNFDTLLKRYGVTITGNVELDARNLNKAMTASVSSKLNTDMENQALTSEKPAIPWENLMRQVGAPFTGDLSTDKANFDNKIREMQNSKALNNTQKANINVLLAEAGIVFVSMAAPEQRTLSALDISAIVNKQFFFGGSMSSF